MQIERVDPPSQANDPGATPLGAVTVKLTGEIDLATAEQTLAALEDTIVETATPCLVLDMADVGFLDSRGLTMLMTLRQRLGERAGQLRVVHPSAPVRLVLDVAGCADHLPGNGHR